MCAIDVGINNRNSCIGQPQVDFALAVGDNSGGMVIGGNPCNIGDSLACQPSKGVGIKSEVATAIGGGIGRCATICTVAYILATTVTCCFNAATRDGDIAARTVIST